MASHFFALFSRMKYINRWALMRNTSSESLSSHSLETAAIAHALAVIGNRRLNKNYDPARAALLGMYHDMPEIITGDMPTPVKYYSPDIRKAYAEIEKTAEGSIITSLPEDLREDFAPLISQGKNDKELLPLIKAADKLSALIKCTEEIKSGNSEFNKALSSTKAALKKLCLPEANIFMDEFMGSFSMVLDSVLAPADNKR